MARHDDIVDDYHGTNVADPYRWLEDPDSPETRAWIEEQNATTFAYLDGIPSRPAIKERLTRLWNYERYSLPWKDGGRYFIFRNDGLQNQSVLYTMSALDAEPRLLLDPNLLSADGTVALSSVAVSEDGRQLAYSISQAGSDWQTWRVRDVETATDLPDLLNWSKFSGAAWTHDGRGFYYCRYPEPEDETTEVNYFQTLYYHRLGDAQAEDLLVYERPDEKEWSFAPAVTDDGRYLVIHVGRGTDPKNQVFLRDLAADRPVVELITGFDAAFDVIGSDGTQFWFRTDLDAPRGRIILVDIRQPERRNWREVIPQSEETLESVGFVGDRLIATYLKDAHSVVRIYHRDGTFEREVVLPGIGTVAGFGGRRTDTETFYVFTGFTSPGAVYRYDVPSGASTLYRRPNVDFDPDAFETRQVFYTSKDGTRVPMFLVHKRGLALDGNNPTYLYGYGGFNISLTPAFSPSIVLWMELGGVYAVANLRGGGEYGEEWHQAGTRRNKQNVFDDFIAAAEWLIDRRYTSTPKLAIGGRSNGGLLVGAVMTQRPELFGATLPGVGVMDMLRFQKFTIGWAWVSDYGSSDDPDEFKAIYAYSPLHNIRPGTAYPPTLIVTADHDDRVVPAHSFKFAATLQEAQAGAAPILIRIETDAGHGGLTPVTKMIEEQTDEWAFLVQVFGIEPA
ncbi:MAG: prolyl oligopeptidase family protein [Dehalococcoidia bacterium]